MPRLTRSYSMGAAALLMAASVFLSRIMGLVRDKVVSWQFGAGADTDVYFAAFVIPDFINYLLAGGYVSMTLIPLLAHRFEQDQEDGWAFFSSVLSWITLAVCVLTMIGIIWAPALARLTAPGFSPDQLERLALYLRIILPGQVFFLAGSCLTALLYVRKSFTVPALTPLVYNACIIGAGLAWPYIAPPLENILKADLPRGMTGYAIGVSVGAALGAFALPLRAACAGTLRFRVRFAHPLLKKYIWLALPLMVGQSVVVLDEQLVRVFGSMAGEGVVSLLNYARRIMLVPVGVVAQAAGVASFPFLARLAAADDRHTFSTTLNTALKNGMYVIVPLSALLIATAQPILGFIFEGGHFSAAQTLGATPYLRILLLGVPFWLVQQVIGRAFYAWQDTLTPTLAGTAVTLLVLPMYPLAVRQGLGAGVALMSVVSIALYAAALTVLWGRRFGMEAFRCLARPVMMCCAASVAAMVPAWLATGYGMEYLEGLTPGDGNPIPGTKLIVQGFGIGLGSLIFAALYGLIMACLQPEALRLRPKKARS